MKPSPDTIAAPATAPGRAGIGVIRLSGSRVPAIAEALLGFLPPPRQARRAHFRAADGSAIDDGLALYFPAPHSFTGEQVLELQGHGGPVVLDLLLRRCLELGARLARPGEFSERAFLNDKLDLAQAEAIADLIDAQSERAARLALRSLEGELSRRVEALVEGLITLRIQVEAAIDFPEEEIDFLSDGRIEAALVTLRQDLAALQEGGRQGAVLREGLRVVIAGRPNAGKSSLLNALAGRESAIVTEIPGTTRDLLREHLVLDGLPIQLVDTAGLRGTADKVEQIGIDRAQGAIREADLLLLVVDSSESADTDPDACWPLDTPRPLPDAQTILIRSKCDLSGEPTGVSTRRCPVVRLSATNGAGLAELVQAIKENARLGDAQEGLFLARRRHLEALEAAQRHLAEGERQLKTFRAGELLAEELRGAQRALSEISGAFTADDLLGKIFSSFCIGK